MLQNVFSAHTHLHTLMENLVLISFLREIPVLAEYSINKDYHQLSISESNKSNFFLELIRNYL